MRWSHALKKNVTVVRRKSLTVFCTKAEFNFKATEQLQIEFSCSTLK